MGVRRRQLMKALSGLGVAGVAGCAGVGGGLPSPEVVALLGANVKNTDPTRINDTTSGKATDLIYEALTFVDFQGKPQPLLATSIDRQGPTTFSVDLREGVQFHEGGEMTAEDVKFSFERYKGTPREGDVYTWYDSSTINGDYSITIELKKKYAPFKFSLAGVPIVPKEYAGQTVTITQQKKKTTTVVERSKLAKRPVGTGPYEFEGRESASYFRVTRNSNHWFGGDDAVDDDPPIGTVTFRVVKGQSQQAAALQGGEAAMINSPPAGKIKDYRQNSAYSVKSRTTGGFDMFIYPMHPKAGTPFQNRKVRLGTNKLIPREKIIRKVYDGIGIPAYSPISPLAAQFTSSAFNQEMKRKYSGYDPQTAKQQLDEGFQEAGFEKPFQTTIVTNSGNQQRVDWANIISNEMSALDHFEVSVETLSFSTYVSKLLNPQSHTKNEIYAVGWSAGWDPDAYVHNLFHPEQFTPKCCNINHYKNPEVTELIDRGLSTYSLDQRQQIYEELQRKVVKDSPMAFVQFGKNQIVTDNSKVNGFEIYPIDGNEYAGIYAPISGKQTTVPES